MTDLVRIIIGVFLIVLFISLLPYIGGLALIFLAISLVANLISYITGKKRHKTHFSSTHYYEDQNIENENIRFDTYGRVNPDVIDVEYTEKEE